MPPAPDNNADDLLGQILKEMGYITIYQLDEAREIREAIASSGTSDRSVKDVLIELGYSVPETLTDDSLLLGQILIKLGYITLYQLDEALQVQKDQKERGEEHQPLGSILLDFGYCTPNQLIRAIQVQAQYRKVS